MTNENKDNCPSCDIPWAEHLGVQGLCKELQKAKAQIKWHSGCEDKCGKELDALRVENQRLRSALEKLDAIYMEMIDWEDDGPPTRPKWLQEALSPSAPAEQPMDVCSTCGRPLGLDDAPGYCYLHQPHFSPGDVGNSTYPIAQEPEHHIGDANKMVPSAQEVDSLRNTWKLRGMSLEWFESGAHLEEGACITAGAPAGEWREFVPSPENPVREGDQTADNSDPDHWYYAHASIGATSPVFGQSGFRRFHPRNYQPGGRT